MLAGYLVVKPGKADPFWFEVGQMIKEIFTSADECLCEWNKVLPGNEDEAGRHETCHHCQLVEILQDVLYSYYKKEIKRADVVDVLSEYNIQNLEIIEAIEAIDQLKKE